MHSQPESHDISALQLSVRGPVFAPKDPGFDAELATFNLATPHAPDVAFGALDAAADVVGAVAWAAERGISVSVQSTGHGATNAVEGGLLISTKRMLELSIDPVEKTARVGAGVRWRDVARPAEAFGLMGLSGSTSDVGVIGYTLGGGLPIMGRKYGFATDHVISFDLVTADGCLRHVTPDKDPILFGLLCGSKGNLGIVTSMEFQLFPSAGIVGGGHYFPGEHAGDVAAAFSSWAPTLPSDASASLAFLRLPDLGVVPAPLRGQFMLHLRFVYQGDAGLARRLVEPMRRCAPVVIGAVGPVDDCVGARDAAFSLFLVGLAVPPLAEVLPQVMDDIRSGMAPFATGGTFINLHGPFTDDEDRARAWVPAAYSRLAIAKSRLDPTNIFRHGHVVDSRRAPGAAVPVPEASQGVPFGV